MAQTWLKTKDGIDCCLEERVVRVKTTPRLLETLRADKNASHVLSGELKALYEARFGRPLDISVASLAAEIEIHARLDVFFRRSSKRSRRLPGRPFSDFFGKMQAHTAVIDCGEKAVDNNRFVFDLLAPFFGG